MGTVHQLAAAAEDMPPREAVSAYLRTLDHAESAGTARVYGGVLRRFADKFAAAGNVGGLAAADVTEWFTSQWVDRVPQRYW